MSLWRWLTWRLPPLIDAIGLSLVPMARQVPITAVDFRSRKRVERPGWPILTTGHPRPVRERASPAPKKPAPSTPKPGTRGLAPQRGEGSSSGPVSSTSGLAQPARPESSHRCLRTCRRRFHPLTLNAIMFRYRLGEGHCPFATAAFHTAFDPASAPNVNCRQVSMQLATMVNCH